MIIHKMWRVKGKTYSGDVWTREGWFLFGFVPLYIKTTKHEFYP
jgi:hypothetical protein